jgi:curved DNA-binding protein CbpA
VNPYEILGVDRDASIDDIKRAYRQNAMKMHPDHGGSEEDMKRLTEARDILVDPARRKRFDKTGETESESKAQNEVESTIAPMLADAFANDNSDPIKSICRQLDARRQDFKDHANRHRDGRDKLKKQIERFEKSNERSSNAEAKSFILENLESGLIALEQSIASLDYQSELMTRCLSYLNDLKCPPENEYRSGMWYGLDRGGPSFTSTRSFAGLHP